MVSRGFPRRKLLSLALRSALALVDRQALVERPGAGPLIGPERAVGLEPFRRPLRGFGRAVEGRQRAPRTVARAWASDKASWEDDRGRAGRAPPGARQPTRAEARRRGLMEAAGLGSAGLGYRESLERAKGLPSAPSGGSAR